MVRYGAPVDRVALAAKDGWEASSRQRAKAGEGVTGTGSRGRDEVVEIEGAEQSRAEQSTRWAHGGDGRFGRHPFSGNEES